MPAFTLIVPFYRNVVMLKRQIEEWEHYPSGVDILVVDDGSPEDALQIIEAHASEKLRTRLRLYRITVDIPWNREGARNLAAQEMHGNWLVNVDIDHIMPAAAAEALVNFKANPKRWYRFPRWRVGKADETRRKDSLPNDCEFGRIKPHIDSYLVTRGLYQSIGGYDEDYVGCLGGGSAFLRRLEAVAPVELLPQDIHLHVYTRDKIKDASDWSLSRDTTKGKEITRAKDAARATTPKNPIRFPWIRQL